MDQNVKNETTPMDVSVDCVVFGFDDQKLKILVIEQKQPAGGAHIKLQKAIPGDLVQDDESLDEAARRVLLELTSLEGIYLKQFKAFGNPERVRGLKDQEWLRSFRNHPERRVLTIGYYSLVKMDEFNPKAASFAGKAQWIDVYKIPDLAFDHNDIIDEALAMLRHELVTNNIGFELLPEKFTLSQLQRLHEIILDKKMDKRNFRKNALKNEALKALDEKQKGVLHKPAQLFQYQK
ncbi:MAG: NUDIX hydrolase [Flavobacteriales bacterium]|jgi:8-oxo-dGTP diphosphatase